jgi:hypothetical protein
MNLKQLVGEIDADTARAFVEASRIVIDALLIEGERLAAADTPAARDYEAARLNRAAPPGGWLAPAELRAVAQRLSEAIAAEKWSDGLLCALQILRRIGGAT